MAGSAFQPTGFPLADLIGRRMAEMSLTLDAVASEVRCVSGNQARPDAALVSHWRSGRTTPSRTTVRWLALALHLDVMLVAALADAQRRGVRTATANSGSAFPGVDRDRLTATIQHVRPADRVLVDDLVRAGRDLASRTDTGPAGIVLPDLHTYLDTLHELLARSQPPELEARIKELASAAAQHAGFLYDSAGRPRHAYMLSAEAELLARESGDANRLAEVLVDRAEQYSRRASGPHELNASIALSEAAAATMNEEASGGLRGWVHGQAAADLSAQGDDLASGRHLEQAFRAIGDPSELNLFSEYASAWLESYRGLRALHLGHGEEAAAVFESVLRATDPRLLWERSRALYRLGWALALQDDLEHASELLGEAVQMTAASGDRRGLEAAVAVRERQLGRWRSHPRLGELDEAIRVARAAPPVHCGPLL